MLYSKIEGAGRPLLILHGFLGMSDNWKTLGMQFATEGFEVHLLDLTITDAVFMLRNSVMT
jgi:esterase/lipase